MINTMTGKQTTALLNLSLVFLLLLASAQSLRAEVTAQLSRTTIYDGDTVTLVIESTERDQAGQPDLSVLQQDFEILGTSTSQQVQVINGRRSDKRQWHVELAPLRTGTISIPPVRVGAAETRPLQFEVQGQPAADAAGADQAVFVRTAIEPADGSVFVQQQIRLTVQLYFSVPLSEGGFDDPAVENAVVEQLGEDIQYRTTLNGQQYQVVERRYAIFPEQSGDLSIPAVTFTGRVRSAASGRSPFLGMDEMMDRFFSPGERGRRVRVRSEPHSIDVRPRPDSYTGRTWLPGEQFELRDSWTQGPPEFRVGEPVTRTIEVFARGQVASQLPEIEFPAGTGMRLYPEAPLLENRTDGESVLGSRRQSLAYVPSTAGKQTIPEVRVDWWDTRQQRQQTAVLPAWEINVTGAGGAVPRLPPAATTVPSADEQALQERPDRAAPGRPEATAGIWPWLAAAVGGVAVLAILLWWFRRHREVRNVAARPAGSIMQPARGPAGQPAEQATPDKQINVAVDALRQACNANDAHAAAGALLQWAAGRWPEAPPTSLGALAQHIGSGESVVRELDQVLYAPGKQDWQGQALWAAFQKGLDARPEQQQAGSEALSPLYPDWDKKQQ